MKYTVKQIDRMRELIEGWSTFKLGSPDSVDASVVEDQLRTYVMAGVKSEELEVRLRDLILNNEQDWNRYVHPADEASKKYNKERRDVFIKHYRLEHVMRGVEK